MPHKQGRAELSLFGFLTPFYSVPIVCPGMLGAEKAAISRERGRSRLLRVHGQENLYIRSFRTRGFRARSVAQW